jgi:hypothetical protein
MLPPAHFIIHALTIQMVPYPSGEKMMHLSRLGAGGARRFQP